MLSKDHVFFLRRIRLEGNQNYVFTGLTRHLCFLSVPSSSASSSSFLFQTVSGVCRLVRDPPGLNPTWNQQFKPVLAMVKSAWAIVEQHFVKEETTIRKAAGGEGEGKHSEAPPPIVSMMTSQSRQIVV